MDMEQGRLIDEARGEPVKNAFRLGLEFMDRNRMLAAMTMGTFIVLSLLQPVPGLGLLAYIALGVIAQSVQIYVGRTFAHSGNIEQFVEGAEQTEFKTFLTRYMAPAFGAWLGWFTLAVIFMTLFFILVLAVGVDPSLFEKDALQDQAKIAGLAMSFIEAGLPLMLVALVLTYVYPIAQGRVILSDTLSDAFKAVFSIFSPSVWSGAMQKEYFKYIFVFSLAIIGIAVLIMATMMLLFFIPILGLILMMVWVVFLTYAFNLIMGVANILAREIAEGTVV